VYMPLYIGYLRILLAPRIPHTILLDTSFCARGDMFTALP